MTHIDDLMNPRLLAQRIEDGYVKVRHHPTLPYRILNYSELAAYSRSWDEVTLQCRGKFWCENYAETFVPKAGVTYLFEIIYSANRIVIEYDFEDLVLLAVVDNATGEVHPAHHADWPGRHAAQFPYPTLAEALRAPVRDNAEGFVVRFQDGTMVKLKLERYVQLHKIVTGMSEKTVWEHAAAGNPFEELITDLPDEFHYWLTRVWAMLHKQHSYAAREAVATFESIREMCPPGDRKAFAEMAKRHDNRSLLFCLADGQHDRMNSAIWKQLKPRGDTYMLDQELVAG